MIARTRFVVWTLLLVSSFASPTVVHAQDTTCTYDRCALWFETRFFGNRVVAGSGGVGVSRPAFGGLRVPVLAIAGDSARAHYAAYRKDGPRSVLLGLISLVGVAAGYIVLQEGNYDRNVGAGVALSVAGLALSVASDVNRRRAANHLQLAIWHYNRGLPR
jgi:hypothetical protein